MSPIAHNPALSSLVALLLLSLTLAPPVSGQGPTADWRSLETASFRFHYPAEAEAFTRHTAARLEAIRERVALEVGYQPEGRTEVLVVDPLAAPNGSAWPLRRWPRLILFTTPPEPESALGHFADWAAILALHEEVHLAHLLRPSRQPLEKRLDALVPIGPLARRAPRWVIEGYATYLEGRLTGYGRPHGDLRPALLRRWAQQGFLPGYGELNGSQQRFLGGNFPYLVGSAFLEWLVAREGEDSLRHLWARLSATRSRSFDDAFSGVFGEAPATLYRRFCAELTHQALLQEAAAGEKRGSELWQDLDGRPSAPTLSPDGSRLALVLHRLGEPARLVVFATVPDEEARLAEEKRKAELLRRDPHDVPAVRRKPLAAKKTHELRASNGGDFLTPRFTSDGRALLLTRLEPDAEGRLIPDLYFYELDSGRLRRLTQGAGLRSADPLPGGREAIALRFRYGNSELVRVDLTTGDEKILDAPPFPTTFADPRVSPDGQNLALIVHQDGAWRLEIRSLATPGDIRELPLPPRALVADPVFSPDGRYLYVTLGQDGELDLHRFDLQEGREERITREPGAALGAAVGVESVYFLAFEHDGFDLRRLSPGDTASSAPEPSLTADAGAPPLVQRRPVTELPFEPFPAPLPEARPYGGGPLELLPLVAGSYGPDGGRVELGLRAGDPVGRREALLMVSGGEYGDEEGAGLHLRWRRSPWQKTFSLFHLGSQQGISLGLTREHQKRAFALRWDIGATWVDHRTDGAPGFAEKSLHFALRGRWQHRVGSRRVSLEAGLEAGQGENDDRGFNRLATRWRLELAHEPFLGRPIVLGLETGFGQAGGEADFTLGGAVGSVLPAAAELGRLEQPGLRSRTRVGEDYELVRVDLRLTRWPLQLYGENYRFRQDLNLDELRLWGVEARWQNAAWPFLRLPAFELRAGVLEVLDGADPDVELYFRLSFKN